MKQQEESKNKEKLNKVRTTLTREENMKIMTYPSHFQHTLTQAALRGESIEETYKELEIFEYMM